MLEKIGIISVGKVDDGKKRILFKLLIGDFIEVFGAMANILLFPFGRFTTWSFDYQNWLVKEKIKKLKTL